MFKLGVCLLVNFYEVPNRILSLKIQKSIIGGFLWNIKTLS